VSSLKIRKSEYQCRWVILQIRKIPIARDFQPLETQIEMWRSEGIFSEKPNDLYPWIFFWFSLQHWENNTKVGRITAKYVIIFLVTIHCLLYVARSKMNLGAYLLYSPGLAHWDLSLFLKVKMAWDGWRFSDIIMIESRRTALLILKQCTSRKVSKSGWLWMYGSHLSNNKVQFG
jgi:hypothetical protein